MNELLRDHVTSVGFSLTLSKRQIELLALLHHFGKHSNASNAGHRVPSYIATAHSLMRRGLIPDGYGDKELTAAGRLVCGLLIEAGLLQEALERRGLTIESDQIEVPG